MPRKLVELKEEELSPPPQAAPPPQPPPTEPPSDQAIVPYEQPQSLSQWIRPEDDRIVEHVGGSPVYLSEAAEFGVGFIKLFGVLSRAMGLDDSPKPEGKAPNYLRVRCPSCGQMTVTVAPHVEKYCSGCGTLMPRPERYTAVQPRDSDNGGRVIEAEFKEVDGNA